MREAVATVLVALLLITAGCNGFLGGGNSRDGETPSPVPETTAPDTPTPTPQPTKLEQEYIDSGNEVGRVVEKRLSERFSTSFVKGTGTRDNTIELTVQLTEGEPLYSGLMNVTQTVAVTLSFRTTTDQSVAMAKGTDGKVHFPESVTVDVLNHDGDHVGTVDLDPEQAVAYRIREASPGLYAESVVQKFDYTRGYEDGDKEPGWYLNRSNLLDFRCDFIHRLKKESDPADSSFHKQVPTDNITIYPSTLEIRNEFVWDDDEYGQYFSSAEAAHWGAYYRTSNKSWALPPSAITVYMHRVNEDDFWGRMPVDHVYWILERRKINENLGPYINSAEYEFIEDGD